MSQSYPDLRILHRKAIYPATFGGNLRTLNIAQLAVGVFKHTTIFSMDNTIDFQGTIAGIPVIQEKELHDGWEKFWYYCNALVAKELIVPYTKRAFAQAEYNLFQIEDPLLYPLLKKNNISRFILDEHNVNWEMYSISQPDMKKRIYGKIASRRDKDNEKQALLHAAYVLCCSNRDLNVLVNEVPDIEDRISVIPNCVNIQEYEPVYKGPLTDRKPFEKSRVLFVGTMSHPPNADAVRLICNTIAPQCSDYEFIIVGKNPPKLPWSENVNLMGYVPDVKPIIADTDICLAPIRSGSGTRLKILEYMAMGKPVIATSKGAEGIEYSNGLNIIIEDTVEKYPEIIRQLLDDNKKRAALGHEARRLIEEKYDWELYRKLLEKIYQNVAKDMN